MGAGLAQRGLTVHRDHREAAALASPVVLHHLAAEHLDHLLQIEVAVGELVVTESLLGSHDVAAIEGADSQAGERTFDLGGEAVEAVVLDQQPEKVLVGETVLVLLVGEALTAQHLVDVGTVGGIGVEALLALRLGALTGRADVHHRQPGLLGEGEGARVEGVGQLLVVLGDDPGAAAVGAIQFDQLDAEPLSDQCHRAVQLGGEAARDAAGPVGDLDLAVAHASSLSAAEAASAARTSAVGSSGSGSTSSSPVM